MRMWAGFVTGAMTDMPRYLSLIKREIYTMKPEYNEMWDDLIDARKEVEQAREDLSITIDEVMATREDGVRNYKRMKTIAIKGFAARDNHIRALQGGARLDELKVKFVNLQNENLRKRAAEANTFDRIKRRVAYVTAIAEARTALDKLEATVQV